MTPLIVVLVRAAHYFYNNYYFTSLPAHFNTVHSIQSNLLNYTSFKQTVWNQDLKKKLKFITKPWITWNKSGTFQAEFRKPILFRKYFIALYQCAMFFAIYCAALHSSTRICCTNIFVIQKLPAYTSCTWQQKKP